MSQSLPKVKVQEEQQHDCQSTLAIPAQREQHKTLRPEF